MNIFPTLLKSERRTYYWYSLTWNNQMLIKDLIAKI